MGGGYLGARTRQPRCTARVHFGYISSSLVVNTISSLRCNALSHSCLINLKRYCHGGNGFVRCKKQNPTTSTGHYTCVHLPELSMHNCFPLNQWYPHFYYLLVTPYFTCNPVCNGIPTLCIWWKQEPLKIVSHAHHLFVLMNFELAQSWTKTQFP